MFYDSKGGLEPDQKEWIREEIRLQIEKERDYMKEWVKEEIRLQLQKSR